MRALKSKFPLSTLTCAALLAPAVTNAAEWQLTDQKQQELWRMQSEYDYQAIVKAYVEFMIEHGRDRYGKQHTPLFMTVLNRKTGNAFSPPYPRVIAKPYAPGLRRDHKMRPYDRTYQGSNLLQDIPLYELLYRYTDLTGDKRYAEQADKSIAWFFEHGWSPKTKLPGWGSHMYYDVNSDMAVFAGGNPNDGYNGHEYNYVWPYWDKTPEALTRFARELWNQHINDKQTGGFSRHSTDGVVGYEFPQTGSCYMDAWAREYGRSGDPEMKAHIETLLKLYRSMRDPETGAMSWCTLAGADRREVATPLHNLEMATTLQDAAEHVASRDPALAEEMREFVRFMDDEYLSNDYDKILDVAGKGILTWYTVADRTCMAKGFTTPPAGVDASVGFPLTTPDGTPAASLVYLTPWFPGRSYAGFSKLLRNRYERCEPKHKATYRRALLDTADIYMTIGPEVQFAQYPDNIADAVALLRYVYKLTDDVAYLHRADQIMQMGVKLFFDDTSPLPKITNFDDWYESSLKNASSVAIMRQMLELSLDLKALPDNRRSAPRAVAEEQEGMWHVEMAEPASGMVLQYGPDKEHGMYVSFQSTQEGRQIRFADVITRIPTAAEADKLNGRMKNFTGKVYATTDIPYGGFKDVPRKIALRLRNTGKQPVDVQVTATLHDTYHDNGRVDAEGKRLEPGETASFALAAPELKWIRRLDVDGGASAQIHIESLAFATEASSPHSHAHKLIDSPGDTTYYLDSSGDDRNTGTLAKTAWKSPGRLNAVKFAPGDRILLKAGCEFNGALILRGSGAPGKPIVIDRYGKGANPVIAGGGKVENTIRLHNQQHWEIRNLTITNTDGGGWDDEGRTIRRAVYVTAEDIGDVEHIYLKSLEIRDVRGMYRFTGNQTNGGIICRVTGRSKKTRFVDLRIEGCTFRTKSIDRYPVVVTSSWTKDPACEVTWNNNTLDHTGRAHIVMPASEWPRELVYYFDPEVRKVFSLEKTAAPVSPFTGRVGCEDIFSEMAARLKRSWTFFEATRAKEGEWEFKHSPADKEPSLWATSAMTLGYYGELRALGFEPPWIENEEEAIGEWTKAIQKYLDPKSNLLKGPAAGAPRRDPAYISHSYDWNSRSRVFTADRYSLPPGGLHGTDPLPTREAAIKRFNSFNWSGNTYQVCNILGKEIDSHAEIVRSKGKDPAKDEIIMMLHEMLDKKFENGRWGKGGTADGNMKMAVTYCTFDWPIPDHKALIDFTLDRANGQFKGRGCHSSNQMWVLAEARRQFPDGYRGDEIDKTLAQSFLTFLSNWNEKLNFYGNNWSDKHNNPVVLFMSHLLLDIPIMRGSAVYNWRLKPIITRGKDGTITRNKVTYTTPGHVFSD